MVDIYNIRNTQIFNNLYSTIVLCISFCLTFQRAVKLVEIISNSRHTVATQSS